MSDENYDDDDTETGDVNGPKALRAQLKKLNAKVNELTEERDTLLAAKRTGDLSALLATKKANPKLAKYAARDLGDDITEESVTKWLEEEGELFGYKPEADTDETDEVDDGVADQQQQISRASSTAPQPPSGLTVERINSMTTQQLIEAGLLAPK